MRSTRTPRLDQRLVRPAIALGITYLGYLLVLWAIRAAGWAEGPAALRWLAAGLPMLPVLGMAGVFLSTYRRLDEVERAMHNTALGTGFVLMLLVALFLGRSEGLGLIEDGVRFVWPAGILGWMAGLLAGRSRFR